MPFSAVFGLAPAVRELQNSLHGDRLAGTYLFVGAQGIGKLTLARAFAEAAACLSPVSDPFDSCGRCDSCRRAESGGHPEIVTIAPAGDQTQIWQFWDRPGRPPGALQHTLPFAPTIGRRRVFVIERADTLNEAAANSLLKVLEEPPPYALFVLLTPQASRMLPTILSRSQTIRLSPASVGLLAGYLTDRHGVEPGRARRLAVFAEGRTGAALVLARDSNAEQEIGRAVDLALSIPAAHPLRALRIAEEIRKLASGLKGLIGEDVEVEPEEKSADSALPAGDGPAVADAPRARERVGRLQLGVVVDLMATAYRDLLALRLIGEDAVVINADRRDALAAIAATRPADRWQDALDTLSVARRRVDQNASITLLTDWVVTRLVTACA